MSLTPIPIAPRPLSLKIVETILVSPSGLAYGNDGSDSKGTLTTLNSSSLAFGPLSSGETSETKIIFLSVPYSKTIDNIKIALVDTGGITFANNIFGVDSRSYIDYNIVPSSFFQGLNVNGALDTNNIVVNNRDNLSSQYVYLNVNMPSGTAIGSGVIRLKWFFDWA